jgi:hypothetical protein
MNRDALKIALRRKLIARLAAMDPAQRRAVVDQARRAKGLHVEEPDEMTRRSYALSDAMWRERQGATA